MAPSAGTPDALARLASVLERIPYLGLHHLDLDATEASVRVRLNPRPELLNHVGIFHAGAIYTAAETAAGVAAWRSVPADAAFVLLRSAEVRYLRRAEGAVTVIATTDAAAVRAAAARFAQTGRADLAAMTHATDATGAAVFEGSFDYALRPRRQA